MLNNLETTMKLFALTGTLALVAAKPESWAVPEKELSIESEGAELVLDSGDYSAFGAVGIPSLWGDQPCDKDCKKAFKKAIRHQNKFSEFVSEACDELFLIKSFPEFYSTQLAAGTKYYFGNFELSCGEDSANFNLEIVEQPWNKGADQWKFGVWNFVDSGDDADDADSYEADE